jgi:VanZ family protein
MQHIVVTYDFAEQRIYVDGRMRHSAALPLGTFKNWDPSHYLVFGNEFTGNRSWRGTIAYAAIYDYPLPARDVIARYDTGAKFSGADFPTSLEFDFAQNIHQYLKVGTDKLRGLAPMLSIPAKIRLKPRTIFSFMIDAEGKPVLSRGPYIRDLIRNFALFFPFGVLVFAWVQTRIRPTVLAILVPVVCAGLIAGTLEALQIFLAVRDSSIFDVGANVVGALAGAAGCYSGLWLSGQLWRTAAKTGEVQH